MAGDSSSSYCSIPVGPFINVIEFCPLENASDLLAYANIDSLSICSISLQLDSKSNSHSLSNQLVQSWEKLDTFNYKGITSISWSPVTNIRYLPKCAKIAFGMQNSEACVLTTDFKKDTKVLILQGHKKSINSIAFEPMTGSKLATVSDDHFCLIWDAENGQVLTAIRLLYAGINVCWNSYEPGKLMIGEQSGRIRFYELDDTDQPDTFQPIMCCQSNSGTLTSCHWCPTNPLLVGAAIGNEWVLWNIFNSVLPEESRQAHSGGCTHFRWSNHNEDVFLTQGRPKQTIKVHHLAHRELLFEDICESGSGASWHFNLPICAVACNEEVRIYNLNSLTQL